MYPSEWNIKNEGLYTVRFGEDVMARFEHLTEARMYVAKQFEFASKVITVHFKGNSVYLETEKVG